MERFWFKSVGPIDLVLRVGKHEGGQHFLGLQVYRSKGIIHFGVSLDLWWVYVYFTIEPRW